MWSLLAVGIRWNVLLSAGVERECDDLEVEMLDAWQAEAGETPDYAQPRAIANTLYRGSSVPRHFESMSMAAFIRTSEHQLALLIMP